MKILFDQNLSRKLVKRLADIFPNASHVQFHGLTQVSDSEIWEFAREIALGLELKLGMRELICYRKLRKLGMWMCCLRCWMRLQLLIQSNNYDKFIKQSTSSLVAIPADS